MALALFCMSKRKENSAKKGLVGKTTDLKQDKPRKMPEGGPSTMERIAKGGKRVMSLAERTKERSKALKRPKDW